MTGSSAYFSSPISSAWLLRNSDTIAGLVADSFWRTKQSSTASDSAIVLSGGVGFIKKSTDAFQTAPTDVSPTTNPPNTAGDSPAPTVADVDFIVCESSYGVQDRHAFLVNWQNASSVWRSWIYLTNNDFTSGTWIYLGDGTGPAQGIAMQMGRGTGTKLWATIHDGADLELLELATPTLSVDSRIDLGTATAAEVTAKTFTAFPVIVWNTDDLLYVCGRMNNPQSLGNPSHIIKTVDGGFSFSLIEGTWAADHCSSLVLETDGKVTAVRQLTSNSKLYRGDPSLSLISTLTGVTSMNSGGLFIDLSTGALYACSDTGQSIMIVKSEPPYLTWTDITSDHGTSTGINNIIQL